MTHLTDDDLGALLRETFADHEHLADPDRAVALTSAPPRPRRGRVLLAAAAAVALVAVATTYVGSRGSASGPSAGPSSPPTSSPPTSAPPTGQSNAANHAAAVSLVEQTASRLPVYPGATEVSATDVPPLAPRTMSSSPSTYTVTRSRFWTVRGVPRTVAEWYARHPQQGFVSDGGPNGVGGESRPDGGWIDDVYFDQHPPMSYAPAGASVTVQTTLLSDGSVGIRATIEAVWRPARPAASYVSDVRQVTVGPPDEVRRPPTSGASAHRHDQLARRDRCPRDRVQRAAGLAAVLPQLPRAAGPADLSDRLPHRLRRRDRHRSDVLLRHPDRPSGRPPGGPLPRPRLGSARSRAGVTRADLGVIPDASRRGRTHGWGHDHLGARHSDPDPAAGAGDPRDRDHRHAGAGLPLRPARPRGQPDRRTDRSGVGAAGGARADRGHRDDPRRAPAGASDPGRPSPPPDHRPHLPCGRDRGVRGYRDPPGDHDPRR